MKRPKAIARKARNEGLIIVPDCCEEFREKTEKDKENQS